MHYVSTIVSFQSIGEPNSKIDMVKQSRQNKESSQERIQYLENEVAALNNMMKNNNQDFQ